MDPTASSPIQIITYESPGMSPKEPSSQQPLEWIHATKAKEEFLSDYYQCQNNTLQDPQGQKGARGFLQEESRDASSKRVGPDLKR